MVTLRFVQTCFSRAQARNLTLEPSELPRATVART